MGLTGMVINSAINDNNQREADILPEEHDRSRTVDTESKWEHYGARVITVAATSFPLASSFPCYSCSPSDRFILPFFLSSSSCLVWASKADEAEFRIITVLLWLVFKNAFPLSCCVYGCCCWCCCWWGGYLRMLHFNYSAPAEPTPAAK